LSDIAAKKKYPFELEKAIHNVMFIQHHMQRQDEFNAVSYAIIVLDMIIYENAFKTQPLVTNPNFLPATRDLHQKRCVKRGADDKTPYIYKQGYN
jgi:hypothetical protein